MAQAIESTKWQELAERAREADHQEIVAKLQEVLNGQLETQESVNQLQHDFSQFTQLVVPLMGTIQEVQSFFLGVVKTVQVVCRPCDNMRWVIGDTASCSQS